MDPTTNEVTQLLHQWSAGDEDALERLMPLVYNELRKIAGQHLRHERRNHTLQTTALVHEAYLRLADQTDVRWQNRSHFFAIAAQAMRRILIDYARNQHAQKRGAGEQKVSLDDQMALTEENCTSLLVLDETLSKLSQMDPRQAKIVELRFFADFTLEEIAKFLEISTATVKRDWAVAKAWLYREMAR